MLHFSKKSLFCGFPERIVWHVFDRGLTISLFERKKNDWQAKQEDGKWMDVTKHMLRGFELCEEQAYVKKKPQRIGSFACLTAYISRALKIFQHTLEKNNGKPPRTVVFNFSCVQFIGDIQYNFHRNFGLRKLYFFVSANFLWFFL